MLTNKEIAKRVASIVYKPKQNESDELFAVQLFVEKVLDINENYTKEDIETKINNLLK
jgi:hypothetical protein